MSKQMLIFLGLLLLVFGSGVAVGLFMDGTPAASDASKKSAGSSSSAFFSSQEAQDQVEANTLLSSRIRELEKDLADQKKDQQADFAGRMAFFKKYHKEIRVQAFDDTLKVTPEMAEILGLSKEEQQAIEQHLAETKAAMDKLEDANTTLVKQTANGVTYDIPADPQGKALEDKLNSLVSAGIGNDRAELFMDSGGYDYYGGPFSGFAAQKKEIEIIWTQQNGSPDGSPLYTVKESSANGAWSTSGTDLPTQYQKYLPTNSAP
jgi:hypothetical protein